MNQKDIISTIKETFQLAIQEIGLTEDDFYQLANKLSNNFYNPITFYEELEATVAIKLTEILCLDFSMLQYGYRKKFHRTNVAIAIHENKYQLPINGKTKSIYEEYISEVRSDFRNCSPITNNRFSSDVR